jgi:hypothetical protein
LIDKRGGSFYKQNLGCADVVSRCGVVAAHLESKLKTFDIRLANAKTSAS